MDVLLKTNFNIINDIYLYVFQALRLELSLHASVETLEIDLTSSQSIDSVISKSKVLLSTAGPFAKIGN